MKNMCYTKVTWASKNLLLIFNTSFTKIKSSELRYLIEFNCPIIFVRVLFTASIVKLHGWSFTKFNWNSVRLSAIVYAGYNEPLFI